LINVRLRWGSAVAAIVSILIVGCGSSGSGSSSGASQPSQAAAGGTTAASGSDCMSQAQSIVTKASANAKYNVPSAPIDISKLKGKTIYYVAATMEAPLEVAIFNGIKAAAAAAGLEAKSFDGQGNPVMFGQGVAQAIAAHAGGIILSGIDPKSIPTSMKSLISSHIPYIDSINGGPSEPLYTGDFAHVAIDFEHDGEVMAAYALLKTNCHLNAVVLNVSLFPILSEQRDGIQKIVTSLCPKDCSLKTVEFSNFAQIAAVLPGQTASIIRSNPSAQYLFAESDLISQYMLVGIKQVPGTNVKLISHDGVLSELDAMRSGDVLQADMSLPPNEYIGWAMTDEMARAMLGVASADDTLPTQLYTKDNLPSSDSALFPGFTGYQQAFEHTWGIGS
jgi:ABC-type sugar transport system substrate-binding protein